MNRGWIVLGLAVAAAACSPDQPEAPPSSPAAVVAPPAVSMPAPDEAVARPLLNLTGDGVSLVDPESGSSRMFDFGLNRDPVQRAVTLSQTVSVEEGSNPECGAGALDYARFGALTLWFQDGKFFGWAVAQDGADKLRTASGVGVGSTRAELESAYAADVSETTLGHEFTAGGLSGLLSSPGPDGRITTMWAGGSCIFR